jgi:hypothetical protein
VFALNSFILDILCAERTCLHTLLLILFIIGPVLGLVKHISLFFSLKAEILACRRADRHFYRFLEAFQTVSERQINPLKKRKQRIKLAPARG